MKREILFRGLSITHGTFEFGDLITSFGKTYIGNTVGNHPDNWCEVIPESVDQFTGLVDKNGTKIFEGDEVKYRTPYRTTQTHTGDNIPNGSYTEPMEPGIRETSGFIEFKNGMFTIGDYDNDPDFQSPFSWVMQEWDLTSIKDAISWTRQTAGWFDDPEEGDLQYLIKEVAELENEQQLIEYLSGIEIIGNIHDNK